MLFILNLTGCSGCRDLERTSNPEAVEASKESLEERQAASDQSFENSDPATDSTFAASQEAASRAAGQAETHAGRATLPGNLAGGRLKSDLEKRATRRIGLRNSTAAEGLAAAREFQQQAAEATQKGDHGKAFELTAKAWENAQQFPADAQSQALIQELEVELETLADQANSRVQGRNLSSKRLIDE